MRSTVLVVDPDAAGRGALSQALEAGGHVVHGVAGGRSMLHALAVRRPRLVVLEVDLPDGDGLALLRDLRRRHPRSPGVIVVSGRRREHQRLAGFAAGADDYVVKPCSPGEVAARAAAILRRLEQQVEPPPVALRAGDLVVEPVAQRVTHRGAPVDLTRIQFRLLADLMAEPGRLRSYPELVEAAWGGEELAARQTVIVHVQRLRKRLAMAGCTAVGVESIRGIGYRLALGGGGPETA